MGWFTKREEIPLKLNWIPLQTIQQLDELLADTEVNSLLFKHSTRCGISSFALSRFENEWGEVRDLCKFYFLDLLNFRSISEQVAMRTNVVHQSPQVLLFSKGEVVFHASHQDIDASAIQKIIIP